MISFLNYTHKYGKNIFGVQVFEGKLTFATLQTLKQMGLSAVSPKGVTVKENTDASHPTLSLPKLKKWITCVDPK